MKKKPFLKETLKRNHRRKRVGTNVEIKLCSKIIQQKNPTRTDTFTKTGVNRLETQNSAVHIKRSTHIMDDCLVSLAVITSGETNQSNFSKTRGKRTNIPREEQNCRSLKNYSEI